jgi:phosphoenolpyruvate carboxylase
LGAGATAAVDHLSLAAQRDRIKQQRASRNRFPDLDPLNHLQVNLLKEMRATMARGEEVDERTKRAIHLSINGLSAGLRNSG